MVDALFLAVKVLHVTFASMWVGGGLLNLIVLQPALAKATMGTRQEAMGRLMPAMFLFNNAVGGLVLLTGLLLVTVHPFGWAAVNESAWGRVILFALIATLAALYLSATSIRATLKALGKATAALQPAEEWPPNVRFLQARLRVTILLVNGLVLLVLFVMVLANVLFAGP
ncbi:MAG TPA: hypothetical protein VI818_06970 [Candidatus Thermoplasmatota archaeon]|nr:hypothetical protein [Candidatus Thermoplasmatota archaeon]